MIRSAKNAGEPEEPEPPEQCSDAELVNLCQVGDKAFTELFQRYRQELCIFIKRIVGNEEDAQDLAQEVFIRVHKNIERIDKPGAWIRRVGKNLAIDHLKRKKRVEFVPLPDYAENSQQIEDFPASQVEDIEFIEKLLRSVNKDYRYIVYLHVFEGMNKAQIARHVHKPITTVKHHLMEGTKQLKPAYEKYKKDEYFFQKGDSSYEE